MQDKLFTLEQANRHLPLVRSITRDAVRHYRAAKRAIDNLEPLKRKRDKGLRGAEAALRKRDLAIASHLRALRRLIDEIEALGCHLRDYGKGVVDFPAAALGHRGFVYYCWSLGDDRVRHWHSDNEGFESRRLVTSA